MNKIVWIKPGKNKYLSGGRKLLADEIGAELREGISLKTVKDILLGRFDCVIGTTRIGAIAVILQKLRRKKAIVDHVDPLIQYKGNKFLVGLLENLSFRLADGVMITNEEDVWRVCKRNKNVVKTRLPVDYEKFSNPLRKSIINASDYIDTNKWVIIYTGGLEEVYNIDKIISAMKYLKPEYKLYIFGSGSMKEELEHQIKFNNLNNVKLMGPVHPNIVPGILYFADVCISLCKTPRQVKLLEYIASGTPALCYHKILKHFPLKTGTSLNPRTIATDIKKMSKSKPIEKETVKHHDYEIVAKEYEEIIQHAVQN